MSPDLAKSNFIFWVGFKLYRITKRFESSPAFNSPKSIDSVLNAAIEPLSVRCARQIGISSKNCSSTGFSVSRW